MSNIHQDQSSPRDHIVGSVRGSLERTIYAGAGAGTGKTQALVERIANLIINADVRPENIAAVTFTNAAASELRQRVREELERREVGVAAKYERQKISAALDSLDSAYIGTIHSFAQSLLRERPLSIGLPPVFEVLDTVQGDVRFEEEWSDWLTHALGDESFSGAVINAQRLGLRNPLANLKDLALELHNNFDIVKKVGELPVPNNTDDPATVLRSVLSDLEAAYSLRVYCSNNDDRLLRHIESLLPQTITWITDALENGEAEEQILALTQIAKLTASGGRKGDWSDLESGDSSLAEVRDLLSLAQETIEAGRQSLGEATVVPLVNAVISIVLKYAAKRRTEGTVEFHDLLVLSCEMIDSDPEVRKYFQSRYTHILIDEFQDTDPLQLKLAMRLADREDVTESGGTPTPGAIFVVGDAKQSIYRFRRADLTQLQSLVSSLGAERLSLSQNYRSNPEILEWVNAVFEPWMNGPDGSLNDPNQAEYTSLEPGRDDYQQASKPRVMVMGRPAEGTVELARTDESRDVAKLALSVGSGDWKLPDGSGGLRRSRFNDLCVLMPRRTALAFVEDAFVANGVPYVLEGQTPIFESQTVHELSNNLAAIDDPTDQVAIVAALKSTAWGCSDQDLYDWASNGSKFEYARQDLSTESSSQSSVQVSGMTKVAKGLAGLARYHGMRHRSSTAYLIERFVRERHLREVGALSHPDGERERLIDVFIEMARTLQRSGNGSLREFVRWISRQSEANVRVAEGALSHSDLNAVRVMTVHAAKGLEFPIVALTGMQMNARPPKGESIITEEFGRSVLAVQLGSAKLGLSTQDYSDRAKASKEAENAEHVRLAYVAATRAREHLIVSVHRSAGDNSSLAAKIAEFDALNDVSVLFDDSIVSVGKREPEEPGTGSFSSTYSLVEREQWLNSTNFAVQSAKYRGYITPSELADHSIFESPKPEDNAEATELNPARRGRGGTDVGSAVHEIMQEIDFADHSDLDAIVRSTSEAYNIADSADEIESLVRNVVSAPILAQIAEKRYWREAWVAAEVEPGIEIEGSVDLMIQNPDKSISIVDYKTDSVRGQILAERAVGYEPQLAGYALVLEKLGMTVRDATLIFADGGPCGEVYEHRIDDLELAKKSTMDSIREKHRT